MPSPRRPAYAPILAAYTLFLGLAAFAVRRRSTPPRVPQPSDIVLIGIATFKMSRIVSKDKVMEPVREPFIETTEPSIGSEVNSQPVRSGVRGAIGQLLTCPFCISVWIATALTAAFAVAPRAVRLVASGLTAAAVADSSQYAYSGLREAAAP